MCAKDLETVEVGDLAQKVLAATLDDVGGEHD